jgi:hypothetical protein
MISQRLRQIERPKALRKEFTLALAPMRYIGFPDARGWTGADARYRIDESGGELTMIRAPR